MKKSRYTEQQIAYALRQADTGTPVAEVIRRMGISEQTFYRWKKVDCGRSVGELRRVEQFEDVLGWMMRSNVLPQRSRSPPNECRILT